MKVDVLFACVPVSDFEASLAWYERLFARPPDVIAHEHEVMWQVTDRGWLYIVLDATEAGRSTVSVAVSDIQAATSELEDRGISCGRIERQGSAGRKCVVPDPDGNSIAILEVSDPG
jgi:catechol 2,3-dioxygenase-like lactoylglutathione lyase family enzyme